MSSKRVEGLGHVRAVAGWVRSMSPYAPTIWVRGIRGRARPGMLTARPPVLAVGWGRRGAYPRKVYRLRDSAEIRGSVCTSLTLRTSPVVST